MRSYQVVVGSASELGHVRKSNEDAVFMGERVFAVADGMGGHAAGEVASQIAIRNLAAVDQLSAPSGVALERAMLDAHDEIVAYGRDHVESRGLGSTAVALVLASGFAQIVSVGDSRAYWLVNGQLTQMTVDHSEVEEMVRAGTMTRLEARSSSIRSVVTRSLGQFGQVKPDAWPVQLSGVDRFLLCSDGLTSEVEDEDLLAILSISSEPQRAADKLTSLALRNGGRDNVSVVVVDVVSNVADDTEDTVSQAVEIEKMGEKS